MFLSRFIDLVYENLMTPKIVTFGSSSLQAPLTNPFFLTKLKQNVFKMTVIFFGLVDMYNVYGLFFVFTYVFYL
jgi:hypothetical protein